MKSDSKIRDGIHVIGVLAGVAAVYTSLVAAIGATGPEHEQCVRWVVAGWLVLPPIYFFVEFHWVRSSSKTTPELLKRVQESQELAGRIWAGVAAALAILYLKG